MNTREKFKRRVIELIHGLPYEEAETIELEESWGGCVFDITIGRVMQAIGQEMDYLKFYYKEEYVIIQYLDAFDCEWKLTKEDGSECTDDDQTDETIEKIYNLIK